jgi:Fic family protein
MAAIRKPQEWNGTFIVRLHRELFGELFPNQSGRARTSAVIFGDRAGVEPEVIYDSLTAVAAKIRDALERSCEIAKDESALVEHAFLSAAQTHAELIRIHPFVDGNGRWARFILNLYLIDSGLEVGTIVPTSEKKQYIAALNRAIDNREPGDLANMFVRGFLSQKARRDSGRPPR